MGGGGGGGWVCCAKVELLLDLSRYGNWNCSQLSRIDIESE